MDVEGGGALLEVFACSLASSRANSSVSSCVIAFGSMRREESSADSSSASSSSSFVVDEDYAIEMSISTRQIDVVDVDNA